MEQLKFTLGPYEFFAAIIGGSPLILALFILFTPANSLQNIFLVLKDNLSFPLTLAAALFSYILGGAIQGFSWKYFLFLCRFFLLRLSLSWWLYFTKKNVQITQANLITYEGNLEFEDRLVLLLREKIGIPRKIDSLDARLISYLKQNGSPAPIAAEVHLVNHIMYRKLSLGFIGLSLSIVINLVRLQSLILGEVVLVLLLLLLSYLTFGRSLSFKNGKIENYF